MGKKGFSLIEVSIAIVILMVLSVSLFSVFNQGSYLMFKQRRQAIALFLAQEDLEKIRNSGTPVASVSRTPVLPTDVYPGFSITRAVSGTNYNGSVVSNVTTTVDWQGASGLQSVTLTTQHSDLVW